MLLKQYIYISVFAVKIMYRENELNIYKVLQHICIYNVSTSDINK